MGDLFNLPVPLTYLVGQKFKDAEASKNLTFSPTELTTIHTAAGIPFQLRYCPSLSKKPTAAIEDKPKQTKPDPFENPSSGLLVTRFPAFTPTHILVLNKYPVIREHFILATLANKQQTHLLELDDIAATFHCIKAWRANSTDETPKNLFAFFNSGPHSGASQSHRHVQFLPVESMGKHNGSEWKPVADLIIESPNSEYDGKGSFKVLSNSRIPFRHFARPIAPGINMRVLYEMYIGLYEQAVQCVQSYIDQGKGDLGLHATHDGSVPISYNLAITEKTMIICPRRQEGAMLRHEDGTDAGFVALNGTILGGTLMVKRESEWTLLKSDAKYLDYVLKAVGIPRTPL